jgi:hypothetical protein
VRGKVFLWIALSLGIVLSIVALVQVVLAQQDMAEGRRNLRIAWEAVYDGDLKTAQAALERAGASLSRATRRLESWPVMPSRIIPGIRQNLGVATALAKAGAEFSLAGRKGLDLLRLFPIEDRHVVVPWRDGVVDVRRLVEASEPARRLEASIAKAYEVAASSEESFLIPSVREARAEALKVLGRAKRDAEVASAMTFLLPRALGTEERRTWLLGAENLAELRGRGGFVGSWALAEGEAGRVTLGSFLPLSKLPSLNTEYRGEVPAEYRDHYFRLGGLSTWSNLTMSPNFPSAASLFLERVAASGGPLAQGMLSTDPQALSYLLEVIGPIEVPAVPHPITAENVVEWSLNRAYYQFDVKQERKDALAEVAEKVWQRLISGRDLDPAALFDAFGRSLSEHHLVIYSSDPEEQAVIRRLGISGEVKKVTGDYLFIVGQNAGENKMDYYLERDISYRGNLRDDSVIEGTLELTLRNTAPSDTPLPNYIGGSRPHLGLESGTARTYLSVFVPGRAILREVLVDRESSNNFENRLEFGKRVFIVSLDVKAGESRSVTFHYLVPDVIGGDGYRLTIQDQATVRPDRMRVQVLPPPNWSLHSSDSSDGKALLWEGGIANDVELVGRIQLPFLSRISGGLRQLVSFSSN